MHTGATRETRGLVRTKPTLTESSLEHAYRSNTRNSIRQYTSAYVSIRQHTSAYVEQYSKYSPRMCVWRGNICETIRVESVESMPLASSRLASSRPAFSRPAFSRPAFSRPDPLILSTRILSTCILSTRFSHSLDVHSLDAHPLDSHPKHVQPSCLTNMLTGECFTALSGTFTALSGTFTALSAHSCRCFTAEGCIELYTLYTYAV
jgi:hypothetical protein